MTLKINLKEKIGKGYKDFWHFKGRYKVVKGSRGSKKSKTTAQWIIYHMMKYPLSNTLVIRQTFNTLQDSCWTELKWAAANLGVSHLWKFSKSPLQATYLPTGQKILFRGLDNPLAITSITVEVGHLCFAWWEEAYEVKTEDAFNKVDMSIRGELPPGYFKQHIITFNPWNERHWLKKRFFDVEDDDILAITTNYQINEWLGSDDIKIFEKMKRDNPKRYRVEGLGEWGTSEGLVYENWTVSEFNWRELMADNPKIQAKFGLDFGFVNDETAFCACLFDLENKKCWVFDEIYKKGLLNNEIAKEIKFKGYHREVITADSAEQKSIEELRRLHGLTRIKPSIKGPGSVNQGIQFLQQFEVIVHPSCPNFINELENYAYAPDRQSGELTNNPMDENNHLMDAWRYSCNDLWKQTKAKVLKR